LQVEEDLGARRVIRKSKGGGGGSVFSGAKRPKRSRKKIRKKPPGHKPRSHKRKEFEKKNKTAACCPLTPCGFRQKDHQKIGIKKIDSQGVLKGGAREPSHDTYFTTRSSGSLSDYKKDRRGKIVSP